MDQDELATRVTELLETDVAAFESRVRHEADELKTAIRRGAFDNEQVNVGLEYELYGVDDACALQRIPGSLVDRIGFEREVGQHMTELCTTPQPLSEHGLRAQELELRARLAGAREELAGEGVRLVSDGMWTLPPVDESAREYLLGTESVGEVELARNVTDDPRYHAQGHSDYGPALTLEAPHLADVTGTVLLNGLCTSIQPHFQVAGTDDFPEYFRYALRVAGPLLALGANSPFFPPDLYDDDATAEEVLADAWAEHRIAVFESVLNSEGGSSSVAFPRDVNSACEAVDRIARDDPVVPRHVDTDGTFGDRFAHLRHKHGTYWRWVRSVFDGETRSEANARIEFRPLAAQPTIRDTVSFLAAFAGLLEGLSADDHPVRDLSWTAARGNFYAAARDGLDADLAWIDADGAETTDRDDLFEELFTYASAGLDARGISATHVERLLGPLRVRASRGVTPARWKRREVRRRVEDGLSLAEAIQGAQSAYVSRQRDTLVDGDFTEWIASRHVGHG